MIMYATVSTTFNVVRETTPLASYIMNSVVTNFTASALLAVGATPVMADIASEAGPFTSVAPVLPINLGIPTPGQRKAARQAAWAAHNAGAPWILDPVAIGALVHRTALAHELLDFKPTMIRGNASEIIALAGTGIGGYGVNVADEVDTALDTARTLAQKAECMVAISGAADVIMSISRILRVEGGAEMLTWVTGGGRALGTAGAAFVSAGRTKGLGDLESVAACHTAYLVAAEHAELQAAGLGAFAPLFLDALHSLKGAELKGIPLSWGPPLIFMPTS